MNNKNCEYSEYRAAVEDRLGYNLVGNAAQDCYHYFCHGMTVEETVENLKQVYGD